MKITSGYWICTERCPNWAFFLTHACRKDTEAYEVVERVHWSEQELQAYEKVAMSVADAKGAITAARQDGLKEGLDKGLKKGQLQIAKNMLDDGMSHSQVMRLTGLSESDLRTL